MFWCEDHTMKYTNNYDNRHCYASSIYANFLNFSQVFHLQSNLIKPIVNILEPKPNKNSE